MSRRPRIVGIFTDRMPIEGDNGERVTYGGVGYYRVVNPLTALGHAVQGLPGRSFDPTLSEYLQLFSRHDIVHMTRLENPIEALIALSARDITGRKLVIDCDDDVFHVDPLSPAYEQYKEGSIKRRVLRQVFRWCDAITVSRPRLVLLYRQFNPRVYLLPNFCDPSLWSGVSIRPGDGRIRVGWAGSLTHESDLQVIEEALVRLTRRHPQVKLVFLGYTPYFVRRSGRIPEHQYEELTPSRTFDTYPATLSEAGLDIAIAPLKQSPFNQAKSPIKYFEYSLCRIPTVASLGKDLPYQSVIDDGVNGILAAKPAQWHRALDRLVRSEDERHRIAEAAYRHVVENHQIQRHIHLYEQLYEEVLRLPAKRLPARFAIR